MLPFLLIPALIGVGQAGIEIPRWDVLKIFSSRNSLLYVYAPNDSYSILFCNLYCLYFKVVVGGCSGGGGWGHKVSREVFFWERKLIQKQKLHIKDTKKPYTGNVIQCSFDMRFNNV